MTRRPILLITGMSGAGLSTTLKALEDFGYEAVDNLPLFLLDSLIIQPDMADRPLAVGIDSRTRDFSPERAIAAIDSLQAVPGLDARLIFLDCGDDKLQRRFIETRRRHPLAIGRPVADGIARERQLLAPLRARAERMIDTTDLILPDLKRLLAAEFRLEEDPGLAVFVQSFSFRGGLPREADLVFDVRFLTNPHYDPELKHMTGLDPAVGAAIAADADWPQFTENLKRLLLPMLPRYRQEGKSYLTLAIGCTGGRHRSVFVAETLTHWLRASGHRAGVVHRDLTALDVQGRGAGSGLETAGEAGNDDNNGRERI